jgi:hypothetical protein
MASPSIVFVPVGQRALESPGDNVRFSVGTIVQDEPRALTIVAIKASAASTISSIEDLGSPDNIQPSISVILDATLSITDHAVVASATGQHVSRVWLSVPNSLFTDVVNSVDIVLFAHWQGGYVMLSPAEVTSIEGSAINISPALRFLTETVEDAVGNIISATAGVHEVIFYPQHDPLSTLNEVPSIEVAFFSVTGGFPLGLAGDPYAVDIMESDGSNLLDRCYYTQHVGGDSVRITIYYDPGDNVLGSRVRATDSEGTLHIIVRDRLSRTIAKTIKLVAIANPVVSFESTPSQYSAEDADGFLTNGFVIGNGVSAIDVAELRVTPLSSDYGDYQDANAALEFSQTGGHMYTTDSSTVDGDLVLTVTDTTMTANNQISGLQTLEATNTVYRENGRTFEAVASRSLQYYLFTAPEADGPGFPGEADALLRVRLDNIADVALATTVTGGLGAMRITFSVVAISIQAPAGGLSEPVMSVEQAYIEDVVFDAPESSRSITSSALVLGELTVAALAATAGGTKYVQYCITPKLVLDGGQVGNGVDLPAVNVRVYSNQVELSDPILLDSRYVFHVEGSGGERVVLPVSRVFAGGVVDTLDDLDVTVSLAGSGSDYFSADSGTKDIVYSGDSPNEQYGDFSITVKDLAGGQGVGFSGGIIYVYGGLTMTGPEGYIAVYRNVLNSSTYANKLGIVYCANETTRKVLTIGDRSGFDASSGTLNTLTITPGHPLQGYDLTPSVNFEELSGSTWSDVTDPPAVTYVPGTTSTNAYVTVDVTDLSADLPLRVQLSADGTNYTTDSDSWISTSTSSDVGFLVSGSDLVTGSSGTLNLQFVLADVDVVVSPAYLPSGVASFKTLQNGVFANYDPTPATTEVSGNVVDLSPWLPENLGLIELSADLNVDAYRMVMHNPNGLLEFSIPSWSNARAVLVDCSDNTFALPGDLTYENAADYQSEVCTFYNSVGDVGPLVTVSGTTESPVLGVASKGLNTLTKYVRLVILQSGGEGFPSNTTFVDANSSNGLFPNSDILAPNGFSFKIQLWSVGLATDVTFQRSADLTTQFPDCLHLSLGDISIAGEAAVDSTDTTSALVYSFEAKHTDGSDWFVLASNLGAATGNVSDSINAGYITGKNALDVVSGQQLNSLLSRNWPERLLPTIEWPVIPDWVNTGIWFTYRLGVQNRLAFSETGAPEQRLQYGSSSEQLVSVSSYRPDNYSVGLQFRDYRNIKSAFTVRDTLVDNIHDPNLYRAHSSFVLAKPLTIDATTGIRVLGDSIGIAFFDLIGPSAAQNPDYVSPLASVLVYNQTLQISAAQEDQSRRTITVGYFAFRLGSEETAFIISATVLPSNVIGMPRNFGVEYVYTLTRDGVSQQEIVLGPVGNTDGTTYFGNTVIQGLNAGMYLIVTCRVFTDNPNAVEFNGLCFTTQHIASIQNALPV